METNKGVNALASVLQTRTKDLTNSPSPIDVGEIQSDMSLLTNKFPLPIPQTDYMICRSVALGKIDDIIYRTQKVGEELSGRHVHTASNQGTHGGHTSGDGSHSHTDSDREMEHVHDFLVGEKMRWLQPGDRVLVAWYGNDNVCVIDIIYPATEIGKDANKYTIPY